MTAGYTFGMDEVKEILIKYLNDTKGVYVSSEKSDIMVLDKHDQLIVGTEVIQVFHEI